MISRRTTILTVVTLGSLLLAFSGFNWLFEVARAERHPVAHQATHNAASWDPLYIWRGPTRLQEVSVCITLIAGILALWSLKRDGRKPPRSQYYAGWSPEDDEALRRYFHEHENDQPHRRAG